jgi:hypothetical protein
MEEDETLDEGRFDDLTIRVARLLLPIHPVYERTPVKGGESRPIKEIH